MATAPVKIEITTRTILVAMAMVASAWLLYLIQNIIFILFLAVLIMAVLNPFVTRLEKYKIPRGLSIILTYFVVVGLLTVAIAGVVPPLVEQTKLFANSVTHYVDGSNKPTFIGETLINQVVSMLAQVSSNIAKGTITIFSNLLQVVMIMMLAFYLLLSRKLFQKQAETFFDKPTSLEIERVLKLLETKLGGWMLGQTSLMLLIGLLTYVGLTILGVPFALPLALLAGMLEIVPYLGPILAAIPLIIIGFSVDLWTGIATIALAIVIQQLENYVFVPKVMEKSTGVNPIIILIALAIGGTLAGVIGVIMAVPVVITLQILAKEYIFKG